MPPMRVSSWLVVAMLTASVLCQALGRAQSGSEAEARDIVARFFASYEKKDLDGLMALWSEKSPDVADTKKLFQGTFTRFDKIPLKGWSFREYSANGDSITLSVALELANVDFKTGKTDKPFEGRGSSLRTFCLSRESGAWKIWQYLSSEEYLAEKIGAAKNAADRKSLVDANGSLVNSELGRALFNEGNRLGREAKFPEALNVFLLLKDVASKLGDKMWLAGAIHGIGAVQYAQGQYAESIASNKESLKLAEEANDRQGVAFALLTLGTNYAQVGDYLAALDADQKSLSIYKEMGNRGDMASVLNNIGTIYQILGDYNSALDYYRKCIDVSTAEGLGIGTPLLNTGQIDTLKGDYVEAQQYFLKALALQEAAADKVGMTTTLSSLGANQADQGNNDRALEYFLRCLKIADEIGDKFSTSQTLMDMGEIYGEQGDTARALDFYSRSLKLMHEMGNQVGISKVLRYIGDAQMAQSEYTKAMENFDESLHIAEKIGDKLGAASALAKQARAYLGLGKSQMAAESANRSAAIARELEVPALLIEALTVQGKAFRSMAKPAQAKDAYTGAIAAVEQLRRQVAGGDEDRQRFFGSKIAPYYELADLLAEEGSGLEALSLAEESKARGLVDVLESGKTSVTKAMTADERDAERGLEFRMVSLNSRMIKERLRDKPDQNLLASISTELSKARADYDSFRSDLYVAHPALKVLRGDFNPISPVDFDGLVPDDTLLLEFLVTDERTDLFVLSRRPGVQNAPELKTYSIPIRKSELTAMVERFRALLARRDFGYSPVARSLFDLLLKPAANQLAGKSKVIIVPDGVLWNLPFQALQTSAAHFVIQDHAISYAPSLTALREMSRLAAIRNSSGDSIGLLAFGNSVVQKERSSKIKEVFMDADLQPLPQAESQVRLIGKMYGPRQSKVYLGKNATEDLLKAQAGNCRILHIATHGIIDDASPMYSQIVLSQGEGSSDDGLLEAWEIANMDLKADMVVLSACDTAGGRMEAGEGIIGLSWAFFVAGCPSTVVSQWSVEATSTSELMVEFHGNLLAGLGKAAALRRAELKLMRSAKYSHPFYWAGFVVVGVGN